MFIKGESNYRRLLGDLKWSSTQNFHEVVSYINTKVAALKTCKVKNILLKKKLNYKNK